CGILRLRRGTFYDPSVVDVLIALSPELRQGDAAAGDRSEARAALLAGLTQTTRATTFADGAQAASPLPVLVQEPTDAQAAGLSAAVCLSEATAARDALMVAHATPRLRAEITGLQMPVGLGVSGWVAANRSTIRRSDPTQDLGRLADALGLKTCVS